MPVYNEIADAAINAALLNAPVDLVGRTLQVNDKVVFAMAGSSSWGCSSMRCGKILAIEPNKTHPLGTTVR